MNATILLDELRTLTQQHKEEVIALQQMPDADLNKKPDPSAWSILECVEHLNRYGHFYLPEIDRRIAASSHPAKPDFRSGWLGNYFAKSMLPKEPLNKMNTFKAMNPVNSALGREVLAEFIKQQEHLLLLLDNASKVDLSRTKTAISISKWIKLRLGDTLRVVVYHNMRHIAQIKRMLD